jgi:hypothetical protein
VIPLLRTAELSPDGVVAALARPHAATDPDAVARVAAIVDEVRRRGDAALLDFTKRFDGVELRPEELRVSEDEWAADGCSPAPGGPRRGGSPDRGVPPPSAALLLVGAGRARLAARPAGDAA